ncbi:hypothetical protein [Streptomyces virginiae]|uniref:hypothetical protein n=1 Tax=Streptomyces virginiae TaxID=1961 RepID=UPI002256ADFC|nr:hypothetical protein [Streptomyces virginiae]MCX5174174.1 hypothetical protein [Streptomyces virginiae]
MPENKVVPLTDHVEAYLQPADDLLRHGDHHTQRPTLARQLEDLDAPEGARLLALCETEYDAKAWARQRRASRKPDATVTDPYELDAKPTPAANSPALAYSPNSSPPTSPDAETRARRRARSPPPSTSWDANSQATTAATWQLPTSTAPQAWSTLA